jgi:putative oxidoreductase
MNNSIINRLRDIVLAIADKLRWLPPTLARLTIGVVFIGTGWGKLHNLDKVISFFMDLGIPAARFQAPFVSATELICGSLILVGLITRLAALPLIVSMIVAILTAKLKEISGLNDLFGTIEWLYILLLIGLFVYGPGPLSLDRFLCKRCAGIEEE